MEEILEITNTNSFWHDDVRGNPIKWNALLLEFSLALDNFTGGKYTSPLMLCKLDEKLVNFD